MSEIETAIVLAVIGGAPLVSFMGIVLWNWHKDKQRDPIKLIRHEPAIVEDEDA